MARVRYLSLNMKLWNSNLQWLFTSVSSEAAAAPAAAPLPPDAPPSFESFLEPGLLPFFSIFGRFRTPEIRNGYWIGPTFYRMEGNTQGLTLGLSFFWKKTYLRFLKERPKSDFQRQFSTSKINGIFLIFFHLGILIKETIFWRIFFVT